MSYNPASIMLSPCNVLYGADNLGFTIGGVQVDIKTEYVNIHVDEFGGPRDDDVIKRKILTVTCGFAESDIAMISKSLASAGTYSDASSLTITSGNGLSVKTTAKQLTLHPIYDTSLNYYDDIVIPLASLSGDISFAYRTDTVRVFSTKFMCYPDVDGRLCYFGELSNGLKDRKGAAIYDRSGYVITSR